MDCGQLTAAAIRKRTPAHYDAGADLHKRGAVRELDWSRDAIRMTATVREEKRPWYVTIEHAPDGGVGGRCTCGAYSEAGGCPHVAAALLTIASLFGTKVPEPRARSAETTALRRTLKEQLDLGAGRNVPEPKVAPKTVAPKTKRRRKKRRPAPVELFLQTSYQGDLRVALRRRGAEIPLYQANSIPELTPVLDPLRRLLRASGFFREEFDHQLWSWVAGGHEPPLQMRTSDGPVTIREADDSTEYTAACRWDLAGGEPWIERWLESGGEVVARPCVWIRDLLFFIDTGTLARLRNADRWLPTERSLATGDFEVVEARNKLPGHWFPLLFTRKEWKQYQETIGLSVEGEPAQPIQVEPRARVVVRGDIHPDDEEFDEEFDSVEISTVVDLGPGSEAPLDEVVCGVIGQKLEDAVWTRGATQRHMDAALHIAARAMWSDDPDATLEAALDRRYPAGRSRMRSRIKRGAKSLLKLPKSPRVALGPTDKAWTFADYRVADLARRILLPVAVVEGEVIAEFSAMPVYASPAQLRAAIPALLGGCAECGMELEYFDQPVDQVALDLRVTAIASDAKPDWFELRPEVRAENFVLSDDEWVRLARGDGWVRREDRVLVADLDGAAALEQLRRLWERRRPGAAGGEAALVPRVEILDWAALARRGVALDLPREEKRIVDSLLNLRAMPAARTPAGLRAELRGYQREGYAWLAFLYRHRFGACLADDMGLGKTVQAIALLQALKERAVRPRARAGKRPHLVVMPPSLLFNWASEIARFAPSLEVVELRRGSKKKDLVPADVVLATYDRVRLDIAWLEKVPFHVAIFDEAQAVKTRGTARAKAARRVDAMFTVCLTGTPMENHVGEYHSILDLALPGLLGDPKAFAREVREQEDPPSLRRAAAFVLRRTKELLLDELPPKQESETYLELAPRQKELYTRTVAEIREDIAEAYATKTQAQAGIVALSALMRLRQICVSPALLDPGYGELSPKLKHLLHCLEELRDEGHAALVFSQFTRTLDQVEQSLDGGGIDWVRLDGKVPAAVRKKRVAAFQADDGPPVFLISLKAGGVGLNLTRAGYVFHVDPWWNPAVERQATDRAHRIGQKQTVIVQRLLMRHTIEEKIMTLKATKQKLFERILEGGGKRGGGGLITRDDLDFLLDTTEV